jgi:cobalamin biosynthesis protein CbiG
MRIVVGVGFTSRATAEEVAASVDAACAAAGCGRDDVLAVATTARRQGHPALDGLGVPLWFHSPASLAAVVVPGASAAVAAVAGTASVAEAAALLSSRAERLLVPKRCTATVCTAVAAIGG